MIVKNEATGQSLFVTDHARERWAERASGDLANSLKVAIPFGGQFGADMLLRNGDIVFATKANLYNALKPKAGTHGCRFVATILTIEQAVANMQMHGASFIAEQKKREPASNDSNLAFARLAVEFVLAGTGRQSRNEQLKSVGHDPGNPAYTAALAGAQVMMEALCRIATKD